MRKRYKVAIIGAGRIAGLLEEDPLRQKPCTHIGAYLHFPEHIEVVAVADINPQRLLYFSQKFNIPRTYTSHKKLLETEEGIDIVSITTWTNSHKEIFLDVVDYGVKAVWLEKPIAYTIEEGEEMLKAVKNKDIVVIVNHERRFSNKYRIIKEYLKKGIWGKPKFVYGNVLTKILNGYKKEVNGGSLLHDGTHLIDLLRYYFGEPEIISAKVEWLEEDKLVDKRVTAHLLFQENVYAFIETGGDREYFNFELDIQTEKARIVVGNIVEKVFISEPSRHYTGFKDLVEKPFPHYSPNNFFLEVVSTMIKLLDGEQVENPSTLYDGYMALKIISEIYKFATTKPIALLSK